jgi:hypothetical protein
MPASSPEAVPSGLGALTHWLTVSLQRLLAQSALVAVVFMAIIVLVLFVPGSAISTATDITEVAGAALLFFGGASASRIAKQLRAPAIVLAVLGVTYGVVAAQNSAWYVGLMGIFLGFGLLTLIEFGLRGAGLPGIAGEVAVVRPLDESQSQIRPPSLTPPGALSLWCGYLGLSTLVAFALLAVFR